MYARYLEKRLPLYIAAGLVLALLLGANLFIRRYNGEIAALIEKTRVLGVKRAQIVRETREIRQRAEALEALLPERLKQASGARLLLWGVDRLNESFRNDTLEIGEPETDGGTVTMPVEILFPFDGYGRLLRRVDLLERQTFPFFELERLDFVKGRQGGASCSIKGRLVAPGEAEGGEA